MAKLPSSYRAERDQLVRDICTLVGMVQGSVEAGKYGFKNSNLLEGLVQILHRADADVPFDVEATLEKARRNEQAKERPPLRSVK